MYRFYTGICLFSLLLTHSAFAYDESCSKNVVSASRIDVKIGGRILSLIGWAHRDVSGQNQFFIDLQELHNFSDSKQCLEAQSLLVKMNFRNAQGITNSRQAYSLLMEASEQHAIGFIGTEHSEEYEKTVASNNVMQIYLVLELLKVNCPAIPTKFVEELGFYALGPDKMFAISKPPVHFVGVEDPVENQKGQDLLKKVNDFMDKLTWNLSPTTLKFQKQIRADMEAGKIPQQEHIDSIVAGELNPKNALAVRNALEALRDLSAHALVRNQKIAENLMKRTESGAVLIGLLHIPDLADQLVRACYKK